MKRQLIACVALSLVFVCSLAAYNPGLVASARSSLLASIENVIANSIYFDYNPPDEKGGIEGFKIDLYDMEAKLNTFKIDMGLISKTNSFKLNLDDVVIDIKGKVKIVAAFIPTYGSMIGTMTVKKVEGNVKVTAIPGGDGVVPIFDLTGLDISPSSIHIDAKFKIDGIPLWVLNYIIDEMLSITCGLIADTFTFVIKAEINGVIKKMEKNYPTVLAVPDTDLFVTTTFQNPGILIKDDHVEFPLDGTMFQATPFVRSNVNPSPLPTWFDKADLRNFQMFITNYTVNTALQAISQSTLDHIMVTDDFLNKLGLPSLMTTTTMVGLFPGILLYFPPQQQVNVTLSMIPTLPQNVQFHPDKIDAQLEVNMNFMSTKGKPICNFTGFINTTILLQGIWNQSIQSTDIRVQILNIQLSDLVVVKSYVGPVSATTDQGILNVIFNEIQAAFNRKFTNNPINFSSIAEKLFFNFVFSSAEFKVEEGYMEIAMDVAVSSSFFE